MNVATVAAYIAVSLMPAPPETPIAIEPGPVACGNATGFGCYSATGIALARDASRYTVMHELGHAFDRQTLTPRARWEFTRVVHATGPWFGDDHSEGVEEIFADAYAHCAMHRRMAPGYLLAGTFDWPRSPARFRRVCNTIRAAALGAYR